MSRRPPSKDEKEKQLQESVQRYQNRLAEAQTQVSQNLAIAPDLLLSYMQINQYGFLR